MMMVISTSGITQPCWSTESFWAGGGYRPPLNVWLG